MKKSTDQLYKVNIGSAINKSEGWINLDIDCKSVVDVVGDGKFFRPYTVLWVPKVDIIRCSHVLEHFFPSEVPYILKLYYKYLKEGGDLIIGVPDLDIVIEIIQGNIYIFRNKILILLHLIACIVRFMHSPLRTRISI